MRLLTGVVLFLLISSAGLSAQNSQGQDTLQGTWQIQVINSRSQPSIPGNIEELVAANRHATEITYVQLGTDVRLKVLPLSVITHSFTPLEKIAFIKE